MSIKRTIITAIVGLTLVALVAPTVAQGVTIDELLAQIAQLQAQLTSLQGTGSTTTVSSGACAGVTFSRNLTVGSTGSDVKCLQVLLNNNGYTVATTGAGSPGAETTYFGSRTLVAVKAFQAAQGFTPANQVGPMTRAKLNTMLGGTTTGPVVVPTGAGLAVALAYDNPVSGTLVDGQAQAPLAKLTFTNGDNAAVTIKGLKLQRVGVSADASLTNVYLFDGATRVTDGAAVSSTYINFNNSTGLFTVPAYSSKTITVTADVDGTSGETIGVQVVASTDVTSNASSVRGTFPIRGNLHTLATGTLAGVNFANSTTPASAATIDPQSDYTVWQNQVTVTTRAVNLTRISFRKTGSVKDADLQNFRLYVDGVQVGSAVPNIVLNSNNESLVTFDLTGSPKSLAAGTRTVKLLADIVGGSGLTFTFNLWTAADVTFVDSQYGANVLPQANSTTYSKRSTAEMTVGSGTLTITKMSDSPSGNIVDGATNATLAKFQLKAAGERVKVETLYVSANVSTAGVSGLRNGMLLADGVQIGSTTTLYDTVDSSYDYTTFNLGSSLIVEPGKPVVLEVRGDVYDTGTGDTTNSITSGSTIQVVIEGSASWNNGTGMTSASTVDVPASDVTGNSLTVAQGALTLSTYPAYTAQSAVSPLTGFKLAHFTLTAATTEDVNMTNINVTLDEVSSYITNLYVKYGTQTTSTKATVTAASNDWATNYILPKGTTIDLMVYGDVSSSMTTGTGSVTMAITGTTVNSAVAANSSTATGQTVTYTTGAFTESFANTPTSQAVAGNQTIDAGRFKLTSSYQQYTVSEMRFSVGSDTIAGAIQSASLKDGSTVLATVPYDATSDYFNFTGLNILVPANTSKTVTLAYNLSIPSATAGTSGVDVKPTLTYVKNLDPNGTVDEDTSLTYAANSTLVYGSLPTFSKVELDDSGYKISNGATMDLYKFKVTAAPQGDVNIKQFKLDVAWSDAVTADTLELEQLTLLKDGVDITSSVTIRGDNLGISAEGVAGVSENDTKIIVVWDGTTEDTIPAGTSTTYTLRGVPQGFVVNGATDTTHDSVSLSFSPDTSAVTSGYNYINIGTTKTGVLKLYNSASADASATDVDLIWSDESAIAHSASTTAGTNDWYNSYLLLDSLTSETWTK